MIADIYTKAKIIISKSMKSAGQVLFVFFAFILMAGVSYYYASSLERNHLVKEAENALIHSQAYIEADLLEPKTTLANVAESIRTMILHGDDFDIVKEYIDNITKYMTEDEDMMSYMMGVYGVFDYFEGKFHAGNGWVPDATYVPQDRPWYGAAIIADGSVGVTEPYLDVSMGLVAISYGRVIFDDNGNQLGVVVLDIMLERVSKYAIESALSTESYGILLDKDLNVIAHPDNNFLGRSIYLLNDGETIAADILSGKEFGEYDTLSYMGNRSSLFYKRLNNGWYLGVITPYNLYYQSIRSMAWFISILGFSLALTLSIILVRITRARVVANEKLQLMLDAMPLCTNFWSPKLELIDCNMEAVHMFDMMSKQEYIARFYELSPRYQPDGSRSSEKIIEFVKLTYETGYTRFEWIHQMDDGTKIPCEVTLIRMKHDKEYIVISYTRDLREEKEMISKLKKEIEQRITAETANSAKSSFLATVSHEIRTPMNAILGIAEIQLQNDNLLPDVEEGLLKIHDAGYTLLHIINDMLDLSKIEAGKMVIKSEKYEVASLINDTVHLNIMRLGSKEVDFALDIDEMIPLYLLGDELRIKQILNNLLSNAFKYTDKGSVTLVVKAELFPNESSANLIFQILDTGQGMTKEQIATMFDEYTRFNAEADYAGKVIEGIGLGMSIVQQLVSIMNGVINVDSEVGTGSKFTVTVKQGYEGDPPIGKEIVDQLKKFGFHGKYVKGAEMIREYMPYGNVLVVDDVDTNLYVARGFLSPYGLQIDTATSGFEAIEKLRAGNVYDIIFMDHMMPKMDGMETTKLIRLTGYKKPIVALTANAVVGRAEMFLANGFDDFISKPIDIRQLNTCLNRLIRDRQDPKIIAAARQMKTKINEEKPMMAIPANLDQELKRLFNLDAKKAHKTMDAINNENYQSENDMKLFVISVHGIKNALLNIGETELSKLAYELEKAGKDNDIELLKAEVPAFLETLNIVINKE